MSNCNTYKIESINDLINVGTKLYPFWFRGHSGCFENLLPKVFRKTEKLKAFVSGGSREYEFAYIEEYQRKASMFTDNIPERRDIGWLFMMQHYGAPTRLLDWTENILVAAYFAVQEKERKKEKDHGEIWAICPQQLNKHYAGGKSLWLWDSPQVSYLAKEPFWRGSPRGLAKELGLIKRPKTPLAFCPPLNNPRMVAQSSVFTIHPGPDDKENNTITSLLKTNEKDTEIVRYIIPHECKGQISDDLNTLGINRTRLFPEQESVAVDMLKHWRPNIDEMKKAPECGGQVNDETPI